MLAHTDRLPLLHNHAKTKQHWADCDTSELFNFIKSVNWSTQPKVDWMERLHEAMDLGTGTERRKTKSKRRKEQLQAIVDVWDLRSASFEWTATNRIALSGRRPFDATMHMNVIMTLNSFFNKHSSKSSQFEEVKVWEAKYFETHHKAQECEGTGGSVLVWSFLQEFKDNRYPIPSEWVEELHRLLIQWRSRLEIAQALEEARSSHLANLNQAKYMTGNSGKIEYDLDQKRFDLKCTVLDIFDMVYRSNMKSNETFKGIRFTPMDRATFMDFENAVRNMGLGSAMPAAGNWFRYSRAVIDMDEFCLGYAWEFIAYSAFGLHEVSFLWTWDVNDNFDLKRLDERVKLIKPFFLKLQELFKKRFPDTEFCRHWIAAFEKFCSLTKEGSTELVTATRVDGGPRLMAKMRECIPNQSQSSSPGETSGSALKSMTSEEIHIMVGKRFKAWIDTMVNALLTHVPKTNKRKVLNQTHDLGPFKISKNQPRLVMARFGALLETSTCTTIPQNALKELLTITARLRDEMDAELNCMLWPDMDNFTPNIIIRPQSINIPGVGPLPSLRSLSDFISKATDFSAYHGKLVGDLAYKAYCKERSYLASNQPEKVVKQKQPEQQDKVGKTTGLPQQANPFLPMATYPDINVRAALPDILVEAAKIKTPVKPVLPDTAIVPALQNTPVEPIKRGNQAESSRVLAGLQAGQSKPTPAAPVGKTNKEVDSILLEHLEARHKEVELRLAKELAAYTATAVKNALDAKATEFNAQIAATETEKGEQALPSSSAKSTKPMQDISVKPSPSPQPDTPPESTEPDLLSQRTPMDIPQSHQFDGTNSPEKTCPSNKIGHVNNHDVQPIHPSSLDLISPATPFYPGSRGDAVTQPIAPISNPLAGSINKIMNCGRDHGVLLDEVNMLRAAITVLIDGDTKSRMAIMQKGHLVVPFSELKTETTPDRATAFANVKDQCRMRVLGSIQDKKTSDS